MPNALRVLAARIENGEYGDVRAVGVAVLGEAGVTGHGYGRDGMMATVCLMFQNVIGAVARGLDA